MAGAPDESEEQRFFGAGARVGDRIADRYRVVRELGAGGMGQVVEVEHLELEKRFALKLIRPDRWDATLEARFRREAKALARISSPRVAQVTDFGVDPARGPFYVMELIDGGPLDTLLRERGALSREDALELAIGIAEALADVHAAGIVHRDIKPGNIGVCERGPVRVRLLDFGLATAVDERFGSKITESKRVIGSFPYMAPEQFHGEKPTPRMDVWGLGIVLYEMLAGELPFDAPSTAALIHQILYVEVPTRGAAPRACSRVLRRLLAKDPAERPADASEALVLLQDALDGAPTDETRAGIPTAEATAIPIDRGTRRTATRPMRALAIGLGLAALTALAYAGVGGTLEPGPEETAAPASQRVQAPPPEREPTPPDPAPRDPAVHVEGNEAATETPAAEAVSAPAQTRDRPDRDTARQARWRAAPSVPEPVPLEPPVEEPPHWSGDIIETPVP